MIVAELAEDNRTDPNSLNDRQWRLETRCNALGASSRTLTMILTREKTRQYNVETRRWDVRDIMKD